MICRRWAFVGFVLTAASSYGQPFDAFAPATSDKPLTETLEQARASVAKEKAAIVPGNVSSEYLLKQRQRVYLRHAEKISDQGVKLFLKSQWADARPVFEEAIAWAEVADADEIFLVNRRQYASLIAAALNDLDAAVQQAEPAARTYNRIQRSLSLGTQPQMEAFMLRSQQRNRFQALSLSQLDSESKYAETFAEWQLNGKSVVMDVRCEQSRLEVFATDPNKRAQAEKLLDIRRQLARLSSAAPEPQETDAYRKRLVELQSEEYELANQLMRRSREEAARRDNWISLAAVRGVLPADSVLVDFARIEPYDFQAKTYEKIWRPARYLAWIIPPRGAVRFVNLGSAEEIDALVQRILDLVDAAPERIPAVGEAEAARELQPLLQEAAERIWKPLGIDSAAREVILSPDGELWLTPWAALLPEADRPLLEAHAFRLVNTPRDLLKERAPAAKAAPVMFANPAFDVTANAKRDAAKLLLGNSPTPEEPAARPERGRLPPVLALPGTAAEANAVLPLLERRFAAKPLHYHGAYALESVVKKLPPPSVIVFATHGFYLPGDAEQFTDNPLLRCGLLLAGCNDRATALVDDDGVLTGHEIAGLDFRGTETVVLSACETGRGQVNGGEGVAGLRQAFQIAGARSVVSTLWQVPDRDTALLMTDFFSNWTDGQPQSEALRQAQRMRRNQRRERSGEAHPVFWAAWTVTGA